MQDGDLVSAPSSCPSQTLEAGKARGCEGCPGQQLCLSQSENPNNDALLLRMNAIAHKILVLSGKGGMQIITHLLPYTYIFLGVGKSSVASLLALALCDSGKKVCRVYHCIAQSALGGTTGC